MCDDVTANNALWFATKNYSNPQCVSLDEFIEDYKRFRYVRRLCRRYVNTKEISERLMLNHLVLLTNVFGIPATVRLLFLFCNDPKLRSVLATFLTFLNMLPEKIPGVNGRDITSSKILLDKKLLNRLSLV